MHAGSMEDSLQHSVFPAPPKMKDSYKRTGVCLKLSKGDLQVHDLCSTPLNSSQNHLTRHVENDSSKGSGLIGTHLAMYGFILLSEEFELVITGPMSCVSCPTHISAIKNMPCPQEGKAKHPFLYPSV